MWDIVDYLIDPTFRSINRLFVLLFKNGDDNPTRNYFDKYYIPLVEIKKFNVLAENKPVFDQPVKNKKEAYEKLIWKVKKWLLYSRKSIRLFVSSDPL